jgi:hypothetical protein
MRHAMNVLTEREYCYIPLLSLWGNLTFESAISGNDRRTRFRVPLAQAGFHPCLTEEGYKISRQAAGDSSLTSADSQIRLNSALRYSRCNLVASLC